MKQQFFALTALLLCIFCSMETKAQQTPAFHIGVKGGANFTKTSTESSLEGKYGFGYQAGVMTRMDIGKLYVQGEALFNKRKTSYQSQDGSSSKLSWNAIDIPVVVGYKLIKADDFNVRVFAGGVYSYAFNNKVSASQAIQEGFKKFDKSNIGVTGGVGLDYKNFTVDLRYETGLTSISKEFKSKPHSFSLGIGYFLF
ncbi:MULTISPECIES: porin family protein [unclassified Chryseobacterium]|uniref:porin family protein n=1 Tax=unclassified Chryseobacterium TaxID=2593645 RepID=UPI000E740BEA|nr:MULTISPECIES: porin family protein [unclassified Chryseobacterium]RKE78595.1 outer membrane protein with beta-barrel domain [Chryseobacterium sp. AG363]WFB66129.1 porin family protein [Chryseobacterium sp. WX]